jgi:hypothetical protein
MWILVCDECGDPAIGTINLETGHVHIKGQSISQQCMDYCEKHKPCKIMGETQPKNCKKVSFYWPKAFKKSENKENNKNE